MRTRIKRITEDVIVNVEIDEVETGTTTSATRVSASQQTWLGPTRVNSTRPTSDIMTTPVRGGTNSTFNQTATIRSRGNIQIQSITWLYSSAQDGSVTDNFNMRTFRNNATIAGVFFQTTILNNGNWTLDIITVFRNRIRVLVPAIEVPEMNITPVNDVDEPFKFEQQESWRFIDRGQN
ncbi:hypothetical protein [Phaeocystidibacter luteus]|uniref:Uncharacterized protein n=1 Tax=Phaeocystidibacter luteus TaxID=911197 RepID=A0A6N6RKF5_9FLAO|nr:hypothetical protein [Phaeocystidibacter luteus]KAB2810055.1 hypothetical protein F8C67_07410 [Phaeocystidibacter luteus]